MYSVYNKKVLWSDIRMKHINQIQKKLTGIKQMVTWQSI